MAKLFNLPPTTVCIHLLLAIASSTIWLAGFAIQIQNHHHHTKSPIWPDLLHGHLLHIALLAIYLLHLSITICLPICSRPWLWNLQSKKSALFLEISMIAMAYDDYEDEHWAIAGSRSVAAFSIALAPFLLPIERSGWGVSAIVAMAVEACFLAETVKHTEMEEGFFYAAMVGAVAGSRRVFGYWTKESVVVVLVCAGLVFLHSFLPFYDEEGVGFENGGSESGSEVGWKEGRF